MCLYVVWFPPFPFWSGFIYFWGWVKETFLGLIYMAMLWLYTDVAKTRVCFAPRRMLRRTLSKQ